MKNLVASLEPHLLVSVSLQPELVDRGGDPEVCPTCRECLPSLLEDIVVARRPAGDLDCVGD